MIWSSTSLLSNPLRASRGREEAMKMFGEFEEAWEEHRTEPEEIRAVGSDKVLLLSVEHFRGRDGMEVSF